MEEFDGKSLLLEFLFGLVNFGDDFLGYAEFEGADGPLDDAVLGEYVDSFPTFEHRERADEVVALFLEFLSDVHCGFVETNRGSHCVFDEFGGAAVPFCTDHFESDSG